MRYAIRNKATGYLCFSGKSFRSQSRAVRYAHRRLFSFGMEWFEIVLVEPAPNRPISLYDPNAIPHGKVSR